MNAISHSRIFFEPSLPTQTQSSHKLMLGSLIKLGHYVHYYSSRTAFYKIMSLLPLQLLVLSCLGATEPQEYSLQKKSRRPFQHPFHLDRNLLKSKSFHELEWENPVAVEETLGDSSVFIAIPQTASGSEKQVEKKMSRFFLPNTELHAVQDLRTRATPREISPEENFPSHYSSKREAKPLHKKDAKKFWDHFMSKKNSASEGVVLPIKTNEMREENCRTLPFSQVRTGIQDQQICSFPCLL